MTSSLSLLAEPSIIAFFIGTVAFFLFAKIWTRKPTREEVRINRICPESSGDEPSGNEPSGEGIFDRLAPALAAQIPESGRERKDFQLLLRQAGLYSPAARISIYALRFVLLAVPLLVAGVWAVMAESDQTWRILLVGGVTAGALSIVPRLYVFFRRRRRLRQIRQGLPDVIDMLSMCSSGGLGLSESLQHVAGQISSHPQLAEELLILKRQAELGSLKQALADFSTRVDLPEVRQLVGLLGRGTRLGTQLAGSLNEQASHLRVARRQAAMTQANKLPVKLVLPILFCFAPAALILLTAPAVLELHDFLRPSAATASGGEGFSTGAIFDTLDSLDQGANAPVIGPAAEQPY
ncbi:MAG: type II secretion system F family protein [Planctomycetota bacterium]|jgi:tight adherence protein C